MNESSDADESILVSTKQKKSRAVIYSDSSTEEEEIFGSGDSLNENIDDSFQSSVENENYMSHVQSSFNEEEIEKTENNETKINVSDNSVFTDDEDEDVVNTSRETESEEEEIENYVTNNSNILDSFGEDEVVSSETHLQEEENYVNDAKGVFYENEDHEKGDNRNDIASVREDDNEIHTSGTKIVDTSNCPVEIIENSLNIVEVSSDDELSTSNVISTFNGGITTTDHPKVQVLPAQYQEQVKKITSIESDLFRAKNAMKVIKLENLPDKGKSLIAKAESLNKMLQEEKDVLNNMVVVQKAESANNHNKIEIAWDEIEAGVDAVGPRTAGKKGVAKFQVEKTMAVETLNELHKSLANCPTENDLMEDPKGLKVPLMTHQKRALTWLLWREQQKPSGGILADDMGLGKTLTMISLVIKTLQLEQSDDVDKENYRDKYPGGTLVICPASLINQWSSEVERRTKRGLLSVEVYHGSKRETKSKRLAKHDMVITTYAIILNEVNKNSTVFGVRWRRIILDEAHQIRNHKARTSDAVYSLSGKSRWALTGTPVHNRELDMYSLLKFLRCSPFDDLQVWKHWVSDKSTGGQMRLHAVISSLMLRRTKSELMDKGVLQNLPERKWQLVSVKLEKEEMDIYQKVLIFSRTLFAQFLHQKAAKNQDEINFRFTGAPPDPNGEYFKMRNRLLKLNRVKEVSQHHILVLLLRLRQICCHPSLITKMLQGDEDLGNAEDEESGEINLLEQLNRLDINDDEDHMAESNEQAVGLKEASKGYLNRSNPVFSEDRPSSKIKVLVNILKEKIEGSDKAIVVSQWTSLLQLVAIHLKKERIIFESLDGSIPVHKRMSIVDNFNDPKSTVKVLLLSLTAGGVGLNLIGANHLFLLDLHWNPQLENQAQDRIYRMGQTKNIFVYKFMALDTIEQRIKFLQETKLEMADSMLTGSKKVISSKLTLQDLKMLFEFK